MKATRRVNPARLTATVGFLCALVLAGAGCHRGAERPDIVLVTIDTLRSDHCSIYGYPIPTTPNLDALAGKGVLYRRAYAESSTTATSHAVLMTGRHFRTLGIAKNGGVLAPETVTLAEALRDDGYATAAFVSSFPLHTRFGFSQGFDVYDDTFDIKEASIGRRKKDQQPHDRLASATREHFERWLVGRHDDRPLFLWIHFVDPHAPYHAPVPFPAIWPEGSKSAVKRYDAEVHYADQQLGQLLAVLAAQSSARERLVVVTSDHGEGLGDHQWMSHGVNLYEEAVRVPMIASWPGHLPPGTAVEEPVGLLDVAPGILALLGIDAPTFSNGRNLFGPGDPARSIFLQRRDYKSTHEGNRKISGEMTAIVELGSKLILAPGEECRELYDLNADPHELDDLLETGAAARPAKRAAAVASPAATPAGLATGREAAVPTPEAAARKLEDALAIWHENFPVVDRTQPPLDKEARKALRALGYVD